MTKLKTLKDIEYDKNRLFTDKVRAEAIKWVKKGYYDECRIIWGEEINKWIKHFFNITEEDLE